MKTTAKAKPASRKASQAPAVQSSAKPLPRAPLEGATGGGPLPPPQLHPRHRGLLLPTLEALSLLARAQRACTSGAVTLDRQRSGAIDAGEEGLEHVRDTFAQLHEALLYLGDELSDIAEQLTGEPSRSTPLQHALALQDLMTAQREPSFRRQLEGEALRRASKAFET
jgi:hypothetical protein